MNERIIVFVTCETREQAEKIAYELVAGSLAACVNVLPGIRSCYVWEGKLTWSDEVLLVIKSTRARFKPLEEKVRELHSSTVPEVVAVPIVEGFEKYLDWIDAAVREI